MKSRILIITLVIALAAAVIGGGTLAFFTAKANAPQNEFTAGTVMITADTNIDVEEQFQNVNPGDCFCSSWTFKNTGTKAIELRLVGSGNWAINEDYLKENWEALCFSEFGNVDQGWATVAAAFDAAGAMGSPENPVIVTPCPDSPWLVVLVDDQGNALNATQFPLVDKFHLYYTGGPIEADEEVELCLCVFFNGVRMTNIFQGATFTLNGEAQAVQASNDAPSAVWELWDDRVANSIIDPRLGEIDFSKCKDQAGNPAPCCQPPAPACVSRINLGLANVGPATLQVVKTDGVTLKGVHTINISYDGFPDDVLSYEADFGTTGTANIYASLYLSGTIQGYQQSKVIITVPDVDVWYFTLSGVQGYSPCVVPPL